MLPALPHGTHRMEKAQRRVARGTPAREAQLQFSNCRWQRQEAGQKPLGCPWPGAAASSSARRRSGQWGWGRPMALPQAQPGSPGNQATGLGPAQALHHLTSRLTVEVLVIFFIIIFSFSLLWDVLPLKRSMLRDFTVYLAFP